MPRVMESRGSERVGGAGYIRVFAQREPPGPKAPRAKEQLGHASPSNKDEVSTGARSSSLRSPTFEFGRVRRPQAVAHRLEQRVRPRCAMTHPRRLGLLCQTDQVSADAKQTQTRYGSISRLARRLARQKVMMVATIRARSIRTSPKAPAPLRQAKKSQDQSALAQS